jgi:iron complex outermembrane recepter protein
MQCKNASGGARFGVLLAGVTLGLWYSQPVLAAERDTSGVIEEVIVTSQRRAESIQDVPISVTAYNQQDIERISPRTLRDLDAMAPNVRIGMVTAAPGQGAIFIRGLGYADAENNQPPAVGVIIDGIYQGTNTGQLIDTFDIEQIEINRGPQGVLYGKNTTGGTIVVKRAQPRFNEFGFDLAGQVGTKNERIVKAKVNVPLIDDTLALKLGGIHKERDGFYRNITRGTDAGADEYDAVTFALKWQPNEWFDGVLTYDRIKQRGDIPPQDPRWNGDDPFVNEADFDEFQKLDVDMFGLTMNFDLGFGMLESITGYIDSTDVTGQDFDGSTLNSLATPLAQLHTLRDRDYKQFSQEFKLTGDFNERVSYLIGAFYWDADFDFQQGTNQVIAVPSLVFGVPPGTPCAAVEPFLPFPIISSPLDASLCQFPPGFTVQQTAETVESIAVFGSIDWRITDRLSVSAGVRWLEEKKDFETVFFQGVAPTEGPFNAWGASILPPTEATGAPIVGPVATKDKWDDTIFRFTANWNVTDDNLLYLTFAQGFKSGGIHNRGVDPEFLAYQPESVDSWEIGSKNTLLDGRMRLNASAFITEIKDVQAASVIIQPNNQPPGTNTIVNNLPKRDIWGLELETQVFLTEHWSMRAAAGYINAETDSYEISSRRTAFNQNGTACNPFDNPGFFPDAPAIQPNSCPNIAFTGGDVLFVPEWNYSITAAYDRLFAGGELHASVTARGQDDFNIAGSPPNNFLVQKGYTLIDARLSYLWQLGNDDRLRVSVYGKNLTDKTYKEQILLLGVDGGFQGWGPPRQVALEVTYSR